MVSKCWRALAVEEEPQEILVAMVNHEYPHINVHGICKYLSNGVVKQVAIDKGWVVFRSFQVANSAVFVLYVIAAK
jgi:hypothetical protein